MVRYVELNFVAHKETWKDIRAVNFPENVATKFDQTCNECSRVYLSRAGLENHQRRYTHIVHYTFCGIYVTNVIKDVATSLQDNVIP